MGTEARAVGTLLGHVAEGPLAGWEIIAANGGAIAMKSGACFHRLEGELSADEGWDAVTARLWAKLSDEQVRGKLMKAHAELAAYEAAGGRVRIAGARGAYEATYAEAVRRGVV